MSALTSASVRQPASRSTSTGCAVKQGVYWRATACGHEMGLMISDAKILYFLKKSSARHGQKLELTEGVIDSYHNTPLEKRKPLIAI